MPIPLRVAGVQMDCLFMDKAANERRMLDTLAELASEGVGLVVFPECSLTGYCFESLDEALPSAESIPGPSSEAFRSVCQKHNVHVVYGLLERDADRVFNACVLVGPGGVVGAYRKIHLPYLGVDRFTTPGDRPFAVHQAGDARIGMNICYDGAFPESSRIMALDGADLIALPTNWPPGAECTAQHVMRTRAMENAIYYVAVNRVGTERGFRFIGQSSISAPDGSVLARADHDREAVLRADIDVEWARRKRIVRVPDKHIIDRIADRRPEMYGRLLQK